MTKTEEQLEQKEESETMSSAATREEGTPNPSVANLNTDRAGSNGDGSIGVDLHEDNGGLDDQMLTKIVEKRLSQGPTTEPEDTTREATLLSVAVGSGSKADHVPAKQKPSVTTAMDKKNQLAYKAGASDGSDAPLRPRAHLDSSNCPRREDTVESTATFTIPEPQQEGIPGAYALAPPSALRGNINTMTGTPAQPPRLQQQQSTATNQQGTPGTAIDNSGLAVASPVEDPSSNQAYYHDLPRAQEHNEESQQGRKPLPQSFVATLFIVGIVFVAGIVLLLVFLLAGGPLDETATSTQTTKPTSVMATMSPTMALTFEQLIKQQLPNYTKTALEDTGTPQAQAFQWLLDDPAVTNYTNERLIQRFALATLFLATDGPGWLKNDGWLNYTMHECQWETGDAYALALFASVELLLFLEDREPYSADNVTVPCDTADRYSHLWLNQNLLEGEIPLEMYLLTNLKSIALGINHIKGTISSHVGYLSNLEAFGFVGVDLTGTIPTEIGLLSNLIEFEPIASLTGTLPTEVGMLSKLQVFSMTANLITGHIPTEIGMMQDLLALALEDTLLSGSLPSHVGQLSSLKILNVFQTQLTGSIPSELGRAQSLEAIDFANNFRLNGTLPSELGLLTDLSIVFALFDNAFTGTIPTELAQMTEVSWYWSVAWNQLSGTIPSELGLLTNVEFGVFVDTNRLTGTIPTEMGKLTNSTLAFQCHDNFLTGTIPTELGLLTSFVDVAGPSYGLSLSINHLTGTIPTELGMLGQTQRLAMFDNQLTGTIPSELGNLVDVKILRLSVNQLEGTVPSQIWNLTSALQLRLGNNSLTGTVPSEIGRFSNLEDLSLEYTEMNGTLPSLSALTSLRRLEVGHARFSGTLPKELVGLASIHSFEGLYATGSLLSGPIPDSLCQITVFECDLGNLCGCNCTCPDSLNQTNRLNH
ncbi:LRR receptor-like serine threonine-protein kinase [Seminavis robusta]|uniref:LRR receptor-like serine threonine-protein kinase n=1 Tax=Seminavis robusta TaxID=568900 RepID=A0A9N8HW26_9STRA|nr:LRR receptor-like serine threonine-protein kinase [Seminavis robusta]|eukprot:Sro2116_g315190.1 LRR receptor-like serine threonine-protein kinase (931) ;mRNA; r:5319-8791